MRRSLLLALALSSVPALSVIACSSGRDASPMMALDAASDDERDAAGGAATVDAGRDARASRDASPDRAPPSVSDGSLADDATAADTGLVDAGTPIDPDGRTVAIGGSATCAIVASGAVKCWGAGDSGQLGNGGASEALTPTTVAGLAVPATALALGAFHSCALLTGGAVSCWGRNDDGALGDGTTKLKAVAPVAVSGLIGADSIAAGKFHTCVVSAGALKCWGANLHGELGSGASLAANVPVTVAGVSGATAVAAGNNFTCAIVAGDVSCWGDNYYGQLGNGTSTSSKAPVKVTGVTGAVAIASRNYHACALLTGGTVKCWGRNDYGQLGDGSSVPSSSTAVTVAGITDGLAVAVGDASACAIVTGGAVKCWGYGLAGNLGNGAVVSSAVPVTVQGLTGVSALAAGIANSVCARTASGVVCWGANAYGQLGTGNKSPSPLPVAVAGL